MSKNLSSKEGQWFLKKLTTTQKEIASSLGAKIAVVDAQGQLVTDPSYSTDGLDKLIFSDKADFGFDIKNLFETQEDSYFQEKEGLLVSFWIPIKKDGQIVGAVVGAGSVYDFADSGQKLKQHFLTIHDEKGLEIEEDKFLQKVDLAPKVSKLDIIKKGGELAELTSNLIKETDLKKAF